MKQYNQRDGLPNVQVYDLLGGSDQLLYLGTSNGMFRFNGTKFERLPFQTQPTSVSYLQEHQGVIWCKDFTSRLFYLENDTLKEYFALPEPNKSTIIVSYQWIDSNLIFATRDSLWMFSAKRKKLKLLKVQSDFDKKIIDFKIDKNFLALSVNKKLMIYSLPAYKLVLSFNLPPLNNELTVHKGKFYLTHRGIHDEPAYVIDPLKGVISKIGKLPEKVHSNFIRIWEDEIYWCTNNGAFVYNSATNSFEKRFLPYKRISDLTTDKRGNHWVSTLDHNIYQLPYAKNHVVFSTLPNEERITTLALGETNKILAGTNLGSILEIDLEHATWKSISNKSFDQIQFIDFDLQQKRIYYTHGVTDYSGKTILKQFLGRSLARDNLNNMVYASGELVAMSGPQLMDMPLSKKKEKVIRAGKTELTLRYHRARKVLYDGYRGLFFVAYTDKVIAYSILGDEFEVFQEDGKSLAANDIMITKDNSLWFGTVSEGIWVYSERAGKAVKLAHQPTSGKFIKKMVNHASGIVWVSTDKGLDFYDPLKEQFFPFKEILGFAEIYLYDLLVFDKQLLLATDVGVLKIPINPDIERRGPTLSIKKTLVDGVPWQLENSTLPFKFRNLRIDFTPIHFQSEGQIFAQYRMGKSDSTWTTLPAGIQSLNLFGLPSGEHSLELRLMANNLYSKSVFWNFSVDYPMWQRWWFLLLSTICIILATFFISRNYNKRKTRVRLLQESLAASKLTAMKAQMNPHFLYNVLNSIQGLIYANKKDEAVDYLSKFSDLMRLTLNFSDKQWHEISEEINALALYLQLEAGRFSSDFSYEIRIDEATRNVNPLVPSMLIQPFVENAIKHGLLHKVGLKRLTIDFSLHNDTNRIVISIEDNGIGRKQSAVLAEKRPKMHRSFATQSVKNRLQIINELLEEPVEVDTIDKANDQHQSTGTLVIIRLPFKNE